MSFGEHTRDPDKGRFVALVNKLVHNHNVLFLSSAGNDGPALSSVSAPGGTTDSLIGVGAYVTPEMLTQAYSLLHSEFGSKHPPTPPALPGTSTPVRHHPPDKGTLHQFGNDANAVAGVPYTWSSRGPVSNGALGVSICAPGGAIAPVPLWMLRKKMLMNGTSMSSPSAAGAVAVIVSFLKKNRLPYTSALIRRAIENTARPLQPPGLGPSLGEKSKLASASGKGESSDAYESDYYQDLVFACGRGSIDASAACEYLQQYAAARDASRNLNSSTEAGRTASLSDKPCGGGGGSGGEHSGAKSETCTDGGRETHSSPGSDQDPVSLEEWRISIRVEDGSPARRGSNSTGFGPMNTTHGIFLRGTAETRSKQRASVAIEASPRAEDCPQTKRAIASIEATIILECKASWVEVPSSLVLLGGGRQFPVFVDPVELSSGRAHFTEILGFMRSEDGLSGQKGPLFRVPVVVHKPEPLVDGLMINPLREVLFAPGSVVRRFYEAPVGATYALLRIVTGSATFLGVGNDRTGSMDGYAEFSDVSGRPRQTSEYGTVTSMKSRTADASFRDAYHVSSNVKMTESAKAEDAPSDNRAYSDNLTTKSSVVLGSADARNFVAHIVQISPRKHCAELETRQNFTLRPGTVKESIVQVQGGSVLELCLAQVWSSPGLSLIDRVELVFGGVVPNPNVVHASAGASCFPRVEAVRYLPFLSSLDNCPTLISGYTPRGSLTHIQRVYAPSKGKIRTLGGRDVLPEVGVISQLQLEYKFEVFDSSSSVKLIFPGLNRTVYESEIDGGPFVLVHDKNNQFLFASDIYPQTRTLTKGEYSVTAYLRHDRVDLLEGLREQKLTVEFKLSSEIVLEAFESAHAASMGIEGRRSSRSTASLECGERRAFYFGLPKKSALPKWIAGGDSAVGKMSVDKLLNGSGNSVRKGSDIPSYKLSLAIGPNAGSSQKSDSARTPLRSSENDEATEMDKNSEKLEDEDKREEPDRNDEDKVVDSEKSEPNGTIKGDPFQWFEEAVRKLKVKRLRSLLKRRKISEFEILYQSMEEKYPRDIELVLLGLEKLDVQGCSESRKNKGSDAHKEILKDLASKADKVISRMDACGIATHFGMMIDPESKEEACQRKKFEKKKGQLVEALFRKARALCELSNSDVSADMASTGIGSSTEKDEYKGDESVAKAAPDDFENAIKQLCRWVTLDGKGSIPGSSRSATLRDGSVTNEDLLLLAAKREVRRKRCGVALKLMDTFYGALPSKTIESKEMSVFKETLLQTLEWEHLKEAEFCTRVMKFPNHRAPY
ncbi:unnamed protein product [Chondrus crispus]|uniref:Tripeptidyl-peptidase II n=1 Tax=Chondrus crispus TaxID=2769 RepID=R7QH25_CHOCR|nr:unnamed protein product [Chondrus crispus]CDF36771.1 unnamed protein product [Chondrus crispus]|eukprot:XP_005716590.1 unnamed protein product [Chondrus crispus]